MLNEQSRPTSAFASASCFCSRRSLMLPSFWVISFIWICSRRKRLSYGDVLGPVDCHKRKNSSHVGVAPTFQNDKYKESESGKSDLNITLTDRCVSKGCRPFGSIKSAKTSSLGRVYSNFNITSSIRTLICLSDTFCLIEWTRMAKKLPPTNRKIVASAHFLMLKYTCQGLE